MTGIRALLVSGAGRWLFAGGFAVVVSGHGAPMAAAMFLLASLLAWTGPYEAVRGAEQAAAARRRGAVARLLQRTNRTGDAATIALLCETDEADDVHRWETLTRNGVGAGVLLAVSVLIFGGLEPSTIALLVAGSLGAVAIAWQSVGLRRSILHLDARRAADLHETTSSYRTAALQERPTEVVEQWASTRASRAMTWARFDQRSIAVYGAVLMMPLAATALTSAGVLSIDVTAIALSLAVAELLRHGTRSLPEAAAARAHTRELATVLELPDLRGQVDAVDLDRLEEAVLDLRPGERLVLDGGVGAGKSALLAAACDREGECKLVLCPQAADDHLLVGSLAFNLLLGRAWPASDDDRQAAESLVRELGLGDLLDRLPSGLDQIVGEQGWRLSSGERSIIAVARALLADPDVVLLDGTLDPLDPARAEQVLDVLARHRCSAVVVSST
jgi:ATP-binding cassette subfamily B protein